MTCCVCGVEFAPKNPKRPPKTCSRACTNKMVWGRGVPRKGGPAPRPREVAACAWCGEPVKWAQRPSRQGTYCSRACANHAKTTGGIIVGADDGRARVQLRNGSRQLYSRCLMEGHLRRDLSYDEVVHHVNGDPADDRIENLRVMSRSEHTRLHSTQHWSILRAQGRGA